MGGVGGGGGEARAVCIGEQDVSGRRQITILHGLLTSVRDSIFALIAPFLYHCAVVDDLIRFY